MRSLPLLFVLALVGCAGQEQSAEPIAHAHGFRHHARPNPSPDDSSFGDQAAAVAQYNAEAARVSNGSTVQTSVDGPMPAKQRIEHAEPAPDTHVVDCHRSMPDRMSAALEELHRFDAMKAKIATRCKALEPHCLITPARHAVACTGLGADDTQFVDSVCMVLPQVVAIDESKECRDVDVPVLEVRFGDFPTAIRQQWLTELKTVSR